MTPTPEMIEAAAKVISDVDDVFSWDEMPENNKEQYKYLAGEMLKAALAAMWRPIEEAPKDGSLFAVRLPETTSRSDLEFYCLNPTSRVSYGWHWKDWKFRPFISGTASLPTFIRPTHFAPLSIFEDRK